jgi:hypothetical protein
MTPVNVEPSGDVGRPGIPSYSSSEAVWSSRTQWGAIIAGAFAGFAVTVLMATLGAALGITAGAVGVNTADTVSGDTAEKASTAFGIGAAIWILLTALAVGLVGGWVLNSCARRDRPYSSFIFGGITWAVGVCVALLVAAPGVGGIFSGLGSGGGAAAAAASANSPGMMRMVPPTRQADTGPAQQQGRTDQAHPRANQPLSDEEKAMAKDAADKASAAAAAAAWVTLGAQLISIAATMFAAGWRRHTGARVVTEIRPRPAPMV